MRSIVLPSWIERGLGLAARPVPPHVFAVGRRELRYGAFLAAPEGHLFQEFHSVPLPEELFGSGPLGTPLADPAAFEAALERLQARISVPVKEASLVLPDSWARHLRVELGELPQEPKAWQECCASGYAACCRAVREFDVERFADQVRQTGAGFVVFTTSHAQHFFPAPLESLDHILPGRTAQCDLVADLADALGQRGVKLSLYYHLGASSDPEWLKATGFWETDTSRLFNNWTAMISEAGRRYGDRLAGWWFDDGAISYYYRSAPWERLATAAKAGHANRLVAFNPWELPSPTEFQDYFCGEGNTDPGMGGLVAAGGNGRIASGSHEGLQACATLILPDKIDSLPIESAQIRWVKGNRAGVEFVHVGREANLRLHGFVWDKMVERIQSIQQTRVSS